MFIWEVMRDYRVGFRHNPRQFHPKSFRIVREGGRTLVVGAPNRRKTRGNYRVVAVVKGARRR